jgi:hypothetical protein
VALAGPRRPPVPGDHSGPSVTIHTFDDGSAVQGACGGDGLWRWWRGGGVVGIGVGGGSRRSGEEEAGGLGRRQHHPLVAARLVTGGVCVCVCVCGVYWS